jgi:hypothetical protein
MMGPACAIATHPQSKASPSMEFNWRDICSTPLLDLYNITKQISRHFYNNLILMN